MPDVEPSDAPATTPRTPAAPRTQAAPHKPAPPVSSLAASWSVLRRADLRLAPAALALWAAMFVVTTGRTGLPWAVGGLGLVVLAGAGLARSGLVRIGLVRSGLVRSGLVRTGLGGTGVAGRQPNAPRRWSWQVVAVGAALLTGAGIGGIRVDSVHDGPVSDLARERAIAVVRVQVVGDLTTAAGRGPAWAGPYGRVSVRLLQVQARGATVQVRLPATATITGPDLAAWAAVPPGAIVAATVRLAEVDPAHSEAAQLRIRGRPLLVEAPSWGWRATTAVREGLRTAMRPRPAAQAALVPALVVGDTRAMPADLDEAFRRTGLTHLSAVSGANLVLLLGFLLAVAKRVGVRGGGLRVLAVVGVVGFVAVCRTEPSVLRAAAMGLVGLVGLGATSAPRVVAAGRHTAAGLRCLLVSLLLLLLFDPWLSRSAGFVLSVLATAGIVALARPWARLLQRWLPSPLRGWVAEAVAVPLAAQLVTQPVVTGLSGQISVVGLLANALAGPAVGPATVLGFLTAGLAALPATAGLAGLVAVPTGWAAQPIVWIAEYGARLPGAVAGVDVGPFVLTTLTAACVVGIWLLPVVLRRRWCVVAAAVLLALVLVRPPGQPGWPVRDWAVVACDVGQGDGFVARTSAGAVIVVDTGPDPDPMRRCLDRLRVRTVTLLVLSHFHADHVGGLAGVLAGRTVDLALVSPRAEPAGEAARVHALLAAAGIATRTSPVGETVPLPGGRWHTLGPVGPSPPRPSSPTGAGAGDAADPESSTANDASLVGLLELTAPGGSGVRILFTGDIEPDQQRRLVAAGTDLHCDILKVPHHGSSRQDPGFLAATEARVAIVSAGVGNPYGHPAPSTVARLVADGMTVLRTDQRGGIAVGAGQGWFTSVGQRAP